MANANNLIPNSERTPSERRENAKKAGIASGEKRRKIKSIKENLRIMLEEEVTTADGVKMQGYEATALALLKKMTAGDIAAINLGLDLFGEKSAIKQEIGVAGDLSISVREDLRSMSTEELERRRNALKK